MASLGKCHAATPPRSDFADTASIDAVHTVSHKPAHARGPWIDARTLATLVLDFHMASIFTT
jgi:hypothetical protein